MTIGQRIKQRREQLGLTQDELAKRVGYASRSSINKIELSRDLPLNKVAKMATALDTSPSFLMGWVEDPNPHYNPRELDNMYTDIEDDEYTSEETQKAIRLYEEYQNAPDDVRSVIDRLLKSSQSQP